MIKSFLKPTIFCILILFLGLISVYGQDTTPEPTPTPTSCCLSDIPLPQFPCPINNLIRNGCFQHDLTYWNIDLYGGDSQTTMHIIDGCLYMNVSNDPGTIEWHILLNQTDIELELGKEYVLSFYAKAPIPRDVTINIGQTSYPYDMYMCVNNETRGSEITIPISSQWEVYTIEFTNCVETTSIAQFEVLAGFKSNDLFFDNFILTEKGTVYRYCGDANEDNATNIVDALLIARYYVGMLPGENLSQTASDVNCDGNIDIVDALSIALYYVDVITVLNCCSY